MQSQQKVKIKYEKQKVRQKAIPERHDLPNQILDIKTTYLYYQSNPLSQPKFLQPKQKPKSQQTKLNQH